MSNEVLTLDQIKANYRDNPLFSRYSEERISEMANEDYEKQQRAVELAAAEQESNQGGTVEEEKEFIPPGHDIDEEREISILKRDAAKMEIESAGVASGGGYTKVLEKDVIDYLAPKAQQIVNEFKSDDFEKSLNIKDIRNHAGTIAFKTDQLDDYDVKSDEKKSQAEKREYQTAISKRSNEIRKENSATLAALRKKHGMNLSRKLIDEAGACSQNDTRCLQEKINNDSQFQKIKREGTLKYKNEEEYEEYLKSQLGDNYDRYKQWKENPDSIEFSDKELEQGKNQAFYNKLLLEFREYDDFIDGEKYHEQLQKAIYLAVKPELDSQEEQAEGLNAMSDVIKEDGKEIERKFNQLQKEEKPYVNQLNGFADKLKEIDLKEDDYWNLSAVEYENKVDQYNATVAEYENLYAEYEEKDFKGRYEILVKDQTNFKKIVEKFQTDIEKFSNPSADERKRITQANLIAKAAGMDYSFTARAGMALEEFFVQGLSNFAGLTQGAGLKLIKGLTTDPEKKAEIDKSIAIMEETLANDNRRLAEKRDAKIPPSLTLADIKDGGSFLDYVGEAIADNSPSILTTFIPAAAAIRGGMLLSKSAGLGFAARRAALTAQKTYGLYAMRASQGIFFVGESGGKYGELLSTEYDMRDRVKDIDKLLASEGLTAEDRAALISEKEDLDNDLINNFSFAQKAFSSYGYGGVATLAETMGSLKLVQGVNATAKGLGQTLAKKHLYENSTNFAGVIVKGTIKGLRPAVTKAMPSEVFEEAFTQVGHNAIDIIALNEDKSLLEGLNADFFLKTAITSFAIMGPTTMANTKNILTNEFKTRDEILTNKKDVNELLVIQSKLDKLQGTELKEAKKRRKQLVKKLAFHDAFTLQKLNHMSPAEIREAAEIGRQKRALKGRMRALAQTGDTQSKDFKDADAGIRAQYNALSERQNELLGAKVRKMGDKVAGLNEKYGVTTNLDLAYTLGLNDFAMDAAMTLSDKNKKFSVVTEAAFGDPAAMEAELRAEGYTDAEIEVVLESFSGDAPANGMYTVNGDIIINEGAINKRMHGASGVAEANYAAVAPLEELFHATVKAKGLKADGKLKTEAAAATQELMNLVDAKKEVGAISEDDYKALKERIDMYKSNGEYNYEEMLAQINNAMAIGVLNESDFKAIPSLKSYLNGAINSIFGDSAWMLKVETASDASAFMQNYRANTIEGGKALSAGGEEGDIALPVQEGDRIVAKPKEEVAEEEAMESRGKKLEGIDKIDQEMEAWFEKLNMEEIGRTFDTWYNDPQSPDYQKYNAFLDRKKKIEELSKNDINELRAQLKELSGIVDPQSVQNREDIRLAIQEKFKQLPGEDSDGIDIYTGEPTLVDEKGRGKLFKGIPVGELQGLDRIDQQLVDISGMVDEGWHDKSDPRYKQHNDLRRRKKKIEKLEAQFDAAGLRTKLKKAKGENKENIEIALEEKFKKLPEAVKAAGIDIYTGKQEFEDRMGYVPVGQDWLAEIALDRGKPSWWYKDSVKENRERKRKIEDLETQYSADELRDRIETAKGEAKTDLILALEQKFEKFPELVEDSGVDIYTGKPMESKGRALSATDIQGGEALAKTIADSKRYNKARAKLADIEMRLAKANIDLQFGRGTVQKLKPYTTWENFKKQQIKRGIDWDGQIAANNEAKMKEDFELVQRESIKEQQRQRRLQNLRDPEKRRKFEEKYKFWEENYQRSRDKMRERGEQMKKERLWSTEGVAFSKGKTILAPETEAYMELDNDVLQQGLVSALKNKTDQVFPIAQAIVEKNWGLISPNLNINNQQEMEAAKEVVIDQLVGTFEGSGQGKYSARNTSALEGFSLDPDGDTPGAQVSTYLAKTIKTRKPEIDAAIAERTAGPGIDVTQVGDVAVETTEIVDEAKVVKKPSETTGLDKKTEDTITEAITDSYKGKEVTLAETRNIPKKVAAIYGDMFGINPQTITDKKRNFQKKDAEGLTKAKQFLLKNAKDDFARLPKTVDAEGKGTFIPKNVRDALYTDGELTGTLKDYLDLIRTKPTKPIYRDRTAQTIRGLLGLHIRNRILETTTSKPKRIKSGAVFSEGKKIELVPLKPKQVEVYNKLLNTKGKKSARKAAGIDNVTVTNENRQDIQDKLEKIAGDENIGINPIALKPMTAAGAIRTNLNKVNKKGKETAETKRLREWLEKNDPKALKKDKEGNYINGETYWYRTTDGGYIKAVRSDTGKSWVPPSLKKLKKEGKNLVPQRNKVFWGDDDPNYTRIKKLAEKTYEKKHGKKPPIPKRVRPNANNPDSVFDQASQDQGKANVEIMEDIIEHLEDAVAKGLMSPELAALIIESGYQATEGFIKIAAPFVYRSEKFEYGDKKGFNDGKKFREEHNPPASVVGAVLMYAVNTQTFGNIKPWVKKNYTQTLLSKKDDQILTERGLGSIMPGELFNFAAADLIEGRFDGVRYAAADLNLNSIRDWTKKGKPTMAEQLVIPIKDKKDVNLESIRYQNELIVESKGKPIALDRKKLKVSLPAQNAKSTQAKTNAKNFNVILNDNQRSFEQKENMMHSLGAKIEAEKVNKPRKGISVFDFDDTLAKTKEKVIVNMPDGEIREISAAEFAQTAGDLQEQGAEFDFSNFENVAKDTKEGPLADLARKRQGKFGSGDIYILTARPNSAGPAIKQFLDSIGINIPLKNIVGLEDGSPQAKADWVLNKAAEGYNDFYFADDSQMNVQAVKQILNAVDVKNKTQQVMLSKGKQLNEEFNKQIEEVTGKEAYKKYSDVRGRLEGKRKDKGFIKRISKQFTITPSAEDFMGLMYDLMGRGEQGNKHAKFINDKLMKPYNKAEQELLSAKVAVGNDFAALKESFPSLRSTVKGNPLMQEIGVGPYTRSQAVRVYNWAKQGLEIPGMSKADVNRLVKAVEADPELNVFADELGLITKDKNYPAPDKNWLSGDITTDLMNGIDKVLRKELMTEFNENADIIFSEENKNKLRALYGNKWVEALEDSLRRMKAGSNRPVYVGGGARIVNELLDWLNASVGAVMFINVKSGLLQLISNVNFINWGDNNIYAAAKAFMSKDYWPTVMKLLNSDYLVNRRDGLKINVNEAELADAGRKGGIKGAINYLLDKGFVITRIMDSLAIATGGATFFINRKASLLKRINPDTGKLYTEAEAETKAFDDFYAISEESQQSSNPARISQQQASMAGRVLLAFQNVTMQYNRMTKKAIRDLYNRRRKPGMTQRESDLSNISKIVYYTTVQNLVFNALQQAAFALLFDDEADEEEKNKAADILNGMADSLLFGLGFGGAAISTVKNVLLKVLEESEKKSPDYEEAVWEIFNVSPVLDSKVRKLRTTAKTFSWNMKDIKKRGWSLDNPSYLAISQLISAATNIPIDRVLRKMMNMRQAMDEETRTWQRIALVLGYSGWSVGLPYWGLESTIRREAEQEEKLKNQYKIDAKRLKNQGYKRIPLTGKNSWSDGIPKGMKLNRDYIQVERPTGMLEYWLMPKTKK